MPHAGHGNVVVAAYQEVTDEWWRTASGRFDLVSLELVVTKSGAGDQDAARAGPEIPESVTLLDVTENSEELIRIVFDPGAVPREAAADAAHIANAVMRSQIERACRQAGYEPSVICTPNELMEYDHADDTS